MFLIRMLQRLLHIVQFFRILALELLHRCIHTSLLSGKGLFGLAKRVAHLIQFFCVLLLSSFLRYISMCLLDRVEALCFFQSCVRTV